MNPKVFPKYVEGYQELKERELREKDALNFLLGRYIGVAVNDPKKYPKKPFLEEAKIPEPMSPEEMERMAKLNTIKLRGNIK